jgi:hypothetical protein
MKLTILFTLILVAGISVDAFAMRCGHRLVSRGDTKAEVFIKCGEPSFSEVIAIEAGPGNGFSALKVPVEQWTYNQGPKTLLKILTFKGGKLVDISEGERVPADTGYR